MKKKLVIVCSLFILLFIVFIILKTINFKDDNESVFGISKIQENSKDFVRDTNFIDFLQYKNKTIGELIKVISLKIPFLHKLTTYESEDFNSNIHRDFIKYVFYYDSNNVIIFNFYLPIKMDSIIFKLLKEGKDIYEFVENQDKYYIKQLKVDYKKEHIYLNLKLEEMLPGPNQDPFYKTLDSLKAVLKR